jgi:hypothetical protein
MISETKRRMDMGMNYYIICKGCGTQLRHIGKQSKGIKFQSNITKEEFIKLYNEMEKILFELVDESNNKISLDDFLNNVTDEWVLSEDGRFWDFPDAWC